jgi:hypothetical protein
VPNQRRQAMEVVGRVVDLEITFGSVDCKHRANAGLLPFHAPEAGPDFIGTLDCICTPAGLSLKLPCQDQGGTPSGKFTMEMWSVMVQ